MNCNNVEISVKAVKNTCPLNYYIGQKISTGKTGLMENFCIKAYHAMIPAIMAISHNALFSFRNNPKTIEATCPGKGNVVFYIAQTEE